MFQCYSTPVSREIEKERKRERETGRSNKETCLCTASGYQMDYRHGPSSETLKYLSPSIPLVSTQHRGPDLTGWKNRTLSFPYRMRVGFPDSMAIDRPRAPISIEYSIEKKNEKSKTKTKREDVRVHRVQSVKRRKET